MKHHPLECPACKGYGYTAATAPHVIQQDGKHVTLRRGSGCPTCLGTGRLDAGHPLAVAAPGRAEAA